MFTHFPNDLGKDEKMCVCVLLKYLPDGPFLKTHQPRFVKQCYQPLEVDPS